MVTCVVSESPRWHSQVPVMGSITPVPLSRMFNVARTEPTAVYAQVTRAGLDGSTTGGLPLPQVQVYSSITPGALSDDALRRWCERHEFRAAQ